MTVILAVRPGPSDHAAVDLPAEVWIETGLDAKEFQTPTDPTWLQLLCAESFGIAKPRRLFAAVRGAPAPMGSGCHPLDADASADESTAIEHERARPVHERRRVRRRNE